MVTDKTKVKIQINEFILGRGRVPRFEMVTIEKAKKMCAYRNVFLVIEQADKNYKMDIPTEIGKQIEDRFKALKEEKHPKFREVKNSNEKLKENETMYSFFGINIIENSLKNK